MLQIGFKLNCQRIIKLDYLVVTYTSDIFVNFVFSLISVRPLIIKVISPWKLFFCYKLSIFSLRLKIFFQIGAKAISKLNFVLDLYSIIMSICCTLFLPCGQNENK